MKEEEKEERLSCGKTKVEVLSEEDEEGEKKKEEEDGRERRGEGREGKKWYT